MVLGLSGCPRPEPDVPARRVDARPAVPTTWRSVSAGIDHTCAIAQDRSVWCWGVNRSGQLGDGSLTSRERPTRARNVRSATLVAAGYRRTFALTSAGALWGWGTVKTKTRSRAELLRYAQPLRTPIPEPVVDYRIGRASCVRTVPGNLWCWRGQYGGSPRNPAATPLKLPGLPKIVDFDSGVNHFCAVDHKRHVWCWGQNAQGQLGDGSRQARARPTRVAGLRAATGVVCGTRSTCAITAKGDVWCWGQLGQPDPSLKPPAPRGDLGAPVGPTPTAMVRPKPLVGVHNVISLVLGSPTTWARTRDGRVLKWKTTGAHTAERLSVEGVGRAAGLRFGSEHRCVLDTVGSVRCWGYNARGQLGDGSLRQQTTPTLVTGIPKLTQLSVGAYHTCGLSHRGRIWCWGDLPGGQRGRQPLPSRGRPRLLGSQ